ncbi:TPA: hypothetical protein ACH3X1_004729 [Trebouxia sp. C0004]
MPSMALKSGSPGCLLPPCAKSRHFHAFQPNCCKPAPVCTCKSAGQSFEQAQFDSKPQIAHMSRRQLLQIAGATVTVLQRAPEAKASLLPEAIDNAWSSIGGGPSDLTFPELFLGTWKVQTTLVKVDTPLGPDFVPDLKVVERAQKEDLQQPQKYLVSFMHNNRGQVVIDRRFNTSQLVSLYLDKPVPEDVITWNPDNPNQLRMALPGSMTINTRVTRRSQETPTPDKISTSEYFQQIFETPGRPQAKVYARLILILHVLFASKLSSVTCADMPDSSAAGHCSLCKGFWLHRINVHNDFLRLAYDALLCMQAMLAVASACEQLVYEQHTFCIAWLK